MPHTLGQLGVGNGFQSAPPCAASPGQLDAVLASYMHRVDQGELVRPSQLIADNPGLATQLRAFFSNEDLLMARTMHAAADLPTTPYEPVVALPPKDQMRHFGDYELLKEIARGGMGVVFQARQRESNRIVAVKLILSGAMATEQEIRRFHEEAHLASRLDHHSIVRVLDIGEYEHHHYYSMEYIRGGNLTDRIIQRPVPAQEAAAILRRIARAVHYAHKRGVLHRDIKPANVLMKNGSDPILCDFGLAKRLDTDIGLTKTGERVGTLNYMAPEQAIPGMHGIGPWTDVYSLGGVLYALLCGRSPRNAKTPEEAMHRIVYRRPASLRQYVTGIPRDLETICLKCLEWHPQDRYLTARQLVKELSAFLMQHTCAS